MRLLTPVLIASLLLARMAPAAVEQWGVFETALNGPAGGNPFVYTQLSADFTDGQKTISVRGFYDGDGVYRIRFMPPEQGNWTYRTLSNRAELTGKTGGFVCVPPSAGNHGPVRVSNVYHFAYADGTPFVCMGTTCYAWVHEPDAIEDQTLATLKASPFDKVRMCLIPSLAEPMFWPYQQDAGGKFDPARFNPDYFHHLERRIEQLANQGVQADLILFHPYKKFAMSWFDNLDDAGDDLYLHYVVARLAAYRNVWWSLANEYGQVKHKTDGDWDHFFQLIQVDDPYQHLRSIHNAARFYDPNLPWVTHACIQNGSAVADLGRAVLYRELCRKPIVYDEVCYEGDIDRRWGKLSAEETVYRFWVGTIGGTYVGHGEVYSHPPLGVDWTSGGGELAGQSPPRLAFLRQVLESGPASGIEPIDEYYETRYGGEAGQYYLVYFGKDAPAEWRFMLPQDPPHKTALAAGMKFHVDVLDTWSMTITPIEKTYTLARPKDSDFFAEGDGSVPLPGRAYIALRIVRIPDFSGHNR
jgi:Domain of unknown function (DUF5060)/Domain of unknown function (DUF5605)/Protein of unknown function (DUF4038)